MHYYKQCGLADHSVVESVNETYFFSLFHKKTYLILSRKK